jgi:rhamnogalacturonyl hydrolase YesR
VSAKAYDKDGLSYAYKVGVTYAALRTIYDSTTDATIHTIIKETFEECNWGEPSRKKKSKKQ